MKLKFIVAVFLAIVLVSQNLSGQDIGGAAILKTSIDGLIDNKMKESGIVGIGVAIIINKNLVWARGYGYADRENKIPFTPTTVMNIASISKTFTGVCLMKAVEDGIVL